MSYNLEWKDRVVIFEYFGDLTSLDILRSNESVYGDARFDRLRWQLVFFDNVKTVKFAKEDVKRIAFCDRGAYVTNPDIRVIFVGETDLVKEMLELYESFTKGKGWMTLFMRERKDAWDFLQEFSTKTI